MCLVCVRLCALKPLLVCQLCERGVSVCIALKSEVVKCICSHVFSSVYIIRASQDPPGTIIARLRFVSHFTVAAALNPHIHS